MHDPSGLAFAVCLYFVVPILLAKAVVGASWKAVAIAYAIWVGVGLLFGLTAGSQAAEAIGWMLILGMFFTIPGIPLITLALRLAGVR